MGYCCTRILRSVNVLPPPYFRQYISVDYTYDDLNVSYILHVYSWEYIHYSNNSDTISFILLQIPDYANEDGNYTLRVEGTTLDGMGGAIFENETELIYDSKQVSLFIQVNKPLYRQGQEGN